MSVGQTFNFTGGWQQLVVPKGVTSIDCQLYGAGASGREGSYVHGSITVQGGDVLWVLVGGQGGSADGHSGGAGGFGGGASGGDGLNAPGGDGGAGATLICWGQPGGQVVAAAGGAGGTSGDGGLGGRGGGDGGTDDGEDGGLGSAGNGETGIATGGTEAQAGNAGMSVYPLLSGNPGNGGPGAKAGAGGDARNATGPGGGGGGSGWRAGGGGAAGRHGDVPGGGGGGGSSHIGYHFAGFGSRGGGNVHHGQVVMGWQDPGQAGDSRPNNPSLRAPQRGARIKGSTVEIRAELTDSDSKTLRMRVEYSKHSDLRHSKVVYSDYVEYHPNSNKKKYAHSNIAKVTLSGLDRATHYYAHIWAEDDQGVESLGYTTADWYTNYPPAAPTLTAPDDNGSVSVLDSTKFTWKVNDPDNQPQAAAIFQYHRNEKGWWWKQRNIPNDANEFVINPRVFRPGKFYTWRVRTQDPNGLWSPWSDTRTFYVEGVALPPTDLHPDNDRVVYGDKPVTLNWRFVNGQRGSNQGNYDGEWKADVRYRIIGGKRADWITWFGRAGMVSQHTFPGGTFVPGYHYEWQARTYNLLGDHVTPGDWSDSATFHSIPTPGRDAEPLPNFSREYHGVLGEGINRAFLVAKGGKHLLGELTPTTQITYGRTRDAISQCRVTMNVKANRRACALAADIRCWQHEIVVYRTTNEGTRRVWEGPVTRISYTAGAVTVEASDVMAWPYRRIMKQGFDDSYPNITSVVERAADLLANAFARDDPDVLRFMTVMSYYDDAQESMVKPDWSATAWEVVDELASRHGLDYTVVGRRIILIDTHRPVGRLPVMRDDFFDTAPTVTEYGMNLATQYGVTNGNGLYGEAHRDDTPYGPVEVLVSAYGSKASNRPGTMTPKQEAQLQDSMDQQAKRGIAHRYPTPLQVHLPDGAGVRADAPLDFDSLVPGVWIPLQAEHLCRTVTQWQKLHSVQVTATPAGEKIQLTMNPAPESGADDNTVVAEDLTTNEQATIYANAPGFAAIGGVVPPPPRKEGADTNSTSATARSLPAGSLTYTEVAAPELWFKWTAPDGLTDQGPLTVTTDGTDYTNTLTVWTSALAELGTDAADPPTSTRTVTVTVNPGDVLYFQVLNTGAGTTLNLGYSVAPQ